MEKNFMAGEISADFVPTDRKRKLNENRLKNSRQL